ncbi:MAG TPA: S53 family peptidase [Trebonia sp.]|nr:S53 family peptidase [Trebonia sp.]
MRLGRVRLLASAATISTLAGALAAVIIPSADAAAGAPVALAGSAAALPAGAVRLGALPASRTLTVDVTLKLGNEAGLDALLAGLADPKSPYFRHFVGKDEFGPEFGLSLAGIDAVRSGLSSLGLNPGPTDPDRLFIPVTGTAAAIGRAFGTTLVNYRLPGGRVAYENTTAPRVPASIAPYIQGIIGLDNIYRAQRASHRQPVSSTQGPAVPAATAAPAAHPAKPCTTATNVAVAFRGYTADELASHYGMTALYKLGDLGQGTRVALAELEPNLSTDIAGYKSCYGITTKVEDTVVDKGVGTGAGEGEAALDIENVAGIAPATTIDVYQDGSTTVDPLFDIASKVAAMDRDQVFSISYGLCEKEAGTAVLAAYQKVFKTLDAKGITTVAASGDSGSTGCYEGGTTQSTVLSPWVPAASPYVLSIGGTAMTSAGPLSTEVAWNGSTSKFPGAGGGGVSALLCMPSYQDFNQVFPKTDPPIAGMVSAQSVKAKSCVSGKDPKGYRRQVPDISADAASSSPYIIVYTGKWFASWGTSAATSLIAGEAALIDSSPYCSAKGWGSGTHVGILPQALYSMMTVNSAVLYAQTPRWALRDITKGNNDDTASGYTGGLYPATKGYDMATGLGAPVLTAEDSFPLFDPGMANEMCDWFAPGKAADVSTHSITPSSVKAGGAVTLTVKGTGYLEIPGTDRAEILTKNNTKFVTEVPAACATHGTCKVRIPGLKAGTYQVEMLVADFLPCTNGCQPFATLTVHK